MTLAKRLEKGSLTFTDGAKPQTGCWSNSHKILMDWLGVSLIKTLKGRPVGWMNPVSLIERTEHQGDMPKTQERIGTGSGCPGTEGSQTGCSLSEHAIKCIFKPCKRLSPWQDRPMVVFGFHCGADCR